MIHDDVLGSVYRDYALEGFPEGTRLMTPEELGGRHPNGNWYAAMITYFGGWERTTGALATTVALNPPLTAYDQHGYVDWLEGRIALLRQRHWFGLAYERGGYC